MNHILFIAGNARSLIANRGDLIKRMESQGHKVSALVPREDMLDEVHDLGIAIHPFNLGRTSMNPINDIRVTARLRRMIADIAPDMTFTYNIKPVIWGNMAAWQAGVPRRYSMITGLGMAFAEPRTWRRAVLRHLTSRLYRISITLCDRVIFQNPDDQAFFIESGILTDSGKAVRVMGSGVNMDRFQRAPLPDSEHPVFLFIGRMIEDKGIANFVEAARNLHRDIPQARFLAVGPHDPALPHAVNADLMQEWMKEGIVEFVGHVSDVRPWLEAASVFVLPSQYREGTPRSALEAMAMGRPVITTDVPGCRETVSHGETGYLVTPGDPADLSQAMLEIIRDPRELARMARASHRMAREHYDVHAVNDRILETMDLS